jgi:hypothetical protein
MSHRDVMLIPVKTLGALLSVKLTPAKEPLFGPVAKARKAKRRGVKVAPPAQSQPTVISFFTILRLTLLFCSIVGSRVSPGWWVVLIFLSIYYIRKGRKAGIL